MGVVLVRDRRPEERHDAVAGVLVHRALEAVHALGQQLEEAVDDPVPLLGIELLGELHRALHVGEEHGHLLALAFERAAGAEYLLGQVLRGVRRRRFLGQSRRRGLRSAAAPAELLARLDCRSARGTGSAEAAPALRAETPVVAVLVAAGRAADRASARGFFWSAARDAPACPPGSPPLSTAREVAVEPAWGRSRAGSVAPAI